MSPFPRGFLLSDKHVSRLPTGKVLLRTYPRPALPGMDPVSRKVYSSRTPTSALCVIVHVGVLEGE